MKKSGHCQKLAPTFEELAKSLEHDTSVSIAKLDCTEYRPICKDFDVKGKEEVDFSLTKNMTIIFRISNAAVAGKWQEN